MWQYNKYCFSALLVNDSNIFIGTNYGVYLSSNNGSSWNLMNNGLYDTNIKALAQSGQNIFAATYNGEIFLSSDNGNHWFDIGLTDVNLSSLVVANGEIYASTLNGTLWKRALTNIVVTNCSAQFTLAPDTINPHHYFITNNAAGIPPLTYLWNWGDGNTDNIAFPTHTYSLAGNYGICLTITDSTGCTNTFCDTSYIQKSTNSIIYVQVIPNTITGIPTNELSNNFKVYPNPTSGNLTISLTDNIKSIEIINLLGENIYCSLTNNNQTKTEIDLTSIPKGIYFVKVDNGEKVFIEKIVLN